LTRLGRDSQSSHVGLGVVVDSAEAKFFANPDGIGISTGSEVRTNSSKFSYSIVQIGQYATAIFIKGGVDGVVPFLARSFY